MTEIKELHRKAMARYDEAVSASIQGDAETYQRNLREAFELERSAADAAARTSCPEPTRSILLRSAATFAIDCGETAEAERLANAGLNGDPPDSIRNELAAVREQVLRIILPRSPIRGEAGPREALESVPTASKKRLAG